MDNVGPQNTGFEERRRLFRNKENNAYTLDPVTFMGLLHTDFNGVEGGILPGVEIKVEISLTPQDFLLHVHEKDTGKYKITITDAKLSLPVATISSQMFINIERSLEKQSAMYYLTKVQISQRCIPAKSRNYVSETLFPTTQIPSRLIIALLPTSTLMGDKHKNPFNFQREFASEFASASARDAATAAGARGSTSTERGGLLGLLSRNTDDDDEPAAEPIKTYVTQLGLYLNGRSIDGWELTQSEVRRQIFNHITFYENHSFNSLEC